MFLLERSIHLWVEVCLGTYESEVDCVLSI